MEGRVEGCVEAGGVKGVHLMGRRGGGRRECITTHATRTGREASTDISPTNQKKNGRPVASCEGYSPRGVRYARLALRKMVAFRGENHPIPIHYYQVTFGGR